MRAKPKSSCLVDRMKYYIDISARDEHLLRELEKEEIQYSPRTQLEFDDQANTLAVVKSGWLYNYVAIDEKKRQVLRIHYPGDLIGLSDVAMNKPFGQLMAATKVVLCPFPKSRLDDIFTQSPRLTALIFSLGMLEQVILMDRLKMMGRSQAVNRVAHFLLEIHARLRIHSSEAVYSKFNIPLNQDVIGDALGLTNVSISNALTQLGKENLLTYHRKTIHILEEQRLKEMTGFQDRHFRIDTSWFPGG